MARRRTKRRRTRKRRPTWSEAHVERLLWRAGFGARTDEVERFAKEGRRATIDWLLDFGQEGAKLGGATPQVDGRQLDPYNEPGHDVFGWLDRMARTSRPLQERMTLFWHDHFATRDVEAPLRINQNNTMRKYAIGSFRELLEAMTTDTALQLFLSLAGSHKRAPNENFARELMELFTLGSGYTEDDIREASRALTGWRASTRNGRVTGVYFDVDSHDHGAKTIFGQTGNWGWKDVLRLCLEHPAHAPFMVEKLWSHFITTPMLPSTREKLAKVYLDNDLRIGPVVRRILDHPHLYADLNRPSMVKAPVVLVVGQLRCMGATVHKLSWTWRTAGMGQHLFHPPSVAGWDWGTGWLSSNGSRARFDAVNEHLAAGGAAEVFAGSVPPDHDAGQHLALARRAVGVTSVSRSTELALRRLIAASKAAPQASHADVAVRRRNAEALQRTLRHLLLSGPDAQVC